MYAYACLCTTHVGPPQVRKEATQPPMKMLSFAEHLLLQNISETLHSLQANMPCLDLEPNRKHFALFYRILFHQDQRAIMIRNNVVASQKSWRWNIHEEALRTLRQGNNDTPYLMKVEEPWIKHEVILFFYSLYNTSYMARIANNQRVKREVQRGVTLFWCCVSLADHWIFRKEYQSVACSPPPPLPPVERVSSSCIYVFA